MAFRRRTSFKGLSPEANRELIALQDDFLRLFQEFARSFMRPSVPVSAGIYNASPGEIVRCVPPTGSTVEVTIPRADAKICTLRIGVLNAGNGGSVKVTPTSGRIDGSANVTHTTAGLHLYEADGLGGWWQESAATGGGGLTPPVALTDLAQIPDETFLGNVSGALGSVTAILLSSLAGTGLTWNSALNRLDASGGGSASCVDVNVTLPFAGKQSDTANVVNGSILATSNILLGWGDVLESDENQPEMDAIELSCTPAAGSMTVRVTAPNGHTVGGLYRLRYLIG